jgi:hypothetical protein
MSLLYLQPATRPHKVSSDRAISLFQRQLSYHFLKITATAKTIWRNRRRSYSESAALNMKTEKTVSVMTSWFFSDGYPASLNVRFRRRRCGHPPETNPAGLRACCLIVPSSLLKSQYGLDDLVLANHNRQKSRCTVPAQVYHRCRHFRPDRLHIRSQSGCFWDLNAIRAFQTEDD